MVDSESEASPGAPVGGAEDVEQLDGTVDTVEDLAQTKTLAAGEVATGAVARMDGIIRSEDDGVDGDSGFQDRVTDSAAAGFRAAARERMSDDPDGVLRNKIG